MRASHWTALILLAASWPLTAAAGSGFEFGTGMEYFSVAAYSRDADGNHFQSVLQSTLGKARLGYTAGPVRLEVLAGLSDWNVSGEWRGTGFVPLPLDDYFTWAGQQQLQAEAAWEPLQGWDVLIGYTDHRLRHYNGDGQATYLDYRYHAWTLGLQVTPLQTSSVHLRVAALYSPRTEVAWYQNVNAEAPLTVQGPLDSAATGWSAAGRLQFEYRDSGGWGIDIGYLAGYAPFASPRGLSEISLRYGALTGLFILRF